MIVGELGTISCDEAGLYEFGLTLSEDAREGRLYNELCKRKIHRR